MCRRFVRARRTLKVCCTWTSPRHRCIAVNSGTGGRGTSTSTTADRRRHVTRHNTTLRPPLPVPPLPAERLPAAGVRAAGGGEFRAQYVELRRLRTTLLTLQRAPQVQALHSCSSIVLFFFTHGLCNQLRFVQY